MLTIIFLASILLNVSYIATAALVGKPLNTFTKILLIPASLVKKLLNK